MKSSKFIGNLFVILLLFLLFACDKIVIIEPRAPLPGHDRQGKPRTPITLGTIRGNFGSKYRTFTQHIERVAPVDSFSNCYFYGSCNGTISNQINLIRCDSDFVLAMFINGYALDSLPASLPVKPEFGKYSEIQFYQFNSWNWGSPEFYMSNNFYGPEVFITDRTDDVLTGTFKGTLRSSSGGIIPVTDGEFKLKIFRKDMSCGK